MSGPAGEGPGDPGKIVDGFEGPVNQAMEEAQKEKESAKVEIQRF